MVKSYPIELRTRVVDHVLEGHTHRSTAIHFKVSIKFVNDMVKLWREQGHLRPKVRNGSTGRGKLAPFSQWIEDQVKQQPDITLLELAARLFSTHQVKVSCWGLCYHLKSLGYTHKKRQFWHKNNSDLI